MSSITSEPFGDGPIKLNVTVDLLEVLKLDADRGTSTFDKCVGFLDRALDVQRRVVSFQSAAVRSNGSTGSSNPSLPGSPGTGLTGTRLNAINKIESWRNMKDKETIGGSCSVKRVIPDGLCYTKLLAKSHVESVSMRAREWPTFGSLVRLSSKAFKQPEQLERFRIVERGDGVYHVAPGGVAGVSFLDAVATYGKKVNVQDGTLAASLRGRVCDNVTVLGKARVGGNVFEGDLKSAGGLSGSEIELLACAGLSSDRVICGVSPEVREISAAGCELKVLDDGSDALAVVVGGGSSPGFKGFFPVKSGATASYCLDLLKGATSLSAGNIQVFYIPEFGGQPVVGGVVVPRVWNPWQYVKCLTGWSVTRGLSYTEFKLRHGI